MALRRASGTVLERPAGGGESPVRGAPPEGRMVRSTPGHEESRRKERGPPRKAKYSSVTDRAQYREGKVKRTPGGE